MSKDGDSFIKFQHADKIVNNSGSGAIYGIGIIGALIYFLSRADSFWAVIVGIVKSVFWPAVFVFEALKILNI